MNITPIIYIQDLDAHEFDWFDGHTTGCDTLEIIANKLPSPEIMIIFSGTQVYLSKVELTNTSLNQLQKAAPFALEEELAEDIEKLQFAYGPIIKNQSVAVATISKTFLSACLNKFKAHGFAVQTCYSAPLLLPIAETACTCAIFKTQALVKTSTYAGFTVPIEQLNFFIELQFQTGHTLPELIHYYDFSDTTTSLSTLVGVPVNYTQKKSTEFLPLLADQISKQTTGINILQGEFKISNALTHTKKTWIIAGIAMTTWLIITLLANITSYIYYTHKKSKLAQQINTLYMQNFPEATAIVSPKLRMERELQKYQQYNSDKGFLSLLEKLGPTLVNTHTINIENLTYQNQKLIFNVNTHSFQELQQFSDQLKTLDLVVQQTNAGNKGKLILATFSIAIPGNMS